MRVFCLTQARLGSTRLPKKILRELGGRPLLDYHVERIARCKTVDCHILATTVSPGDDPLARYAEERGMTYYRGSELDVLERYYEAARSVGASDDDVLLRVTSDCPLIAPELIDEVVETFLRTPDSDYCHLSLAYFPRGFDVEAFRMSTLVEAYETAVKPHEREHVTPYIYDRPERFVLTPVPGVGPAAASYRLCVDEIDDFSPNGGAR